MRRVCWVVLLVGVFTASASAGVGQWKTYTAKHLVRDLTVDRGILWAATNGGLFSYQFSDDTFTEYTTSEGLKTIDLTAITVDANGAIWIGGSNGFLHQLDPSTNEWRYIADISILHNPQKSITRLQSKGDTLFVLSEIGISVFSISRSEFLATFSRFGIEPNLLSGEITGFRLLNNRMWVSTRGGIASTPMSNTNPSAPESWRVYSTLDGLPSNKINNLDVHLNTLFAATAEGLAFFNGESWNIVQGSEGLDVLDLSSSEQPCTDCSSLFFITKSALWRYSGDSAPQQIASFYTTDLTTIMGDHILGAHSGVILISDSQSNRIIIPPGPPSNKFVGIAVDERGVVWSGTGTTNGEGFMSFDGTTWRLYTSSQDPRLDNNYYKVSIGRDNAKWVSSWGFGVTLLDDLGVVQKVLNTSNGLPPSVEGGDPTFVVVGGIATDREGVTWITNRTGLGDTALTKMHPDSSLSYVVGLRTRNPYNVFTDVVIDHNGTKWFSNSGRFEPQAPIGFFYYNEHFHLPGSTGRWGKLTSADGLTSDKVWSVAVDRDGELWVGTDRGVAIIFDPAYPRSTIAAYHPLRDQIIQDIEVDPLNNKWIATKQGVFVLSPDGTSILDRYTVEDTEGKLLDNDVTSIAIDKNTGTVYFGTEKGLSSLLTDAVEPARSFGGLFFHPNPLILPSSSSLTIDGLVMGSSLKILSVDGTLVRNVTTSGGQVGFWDGRNEQGELVATAVYLVIAYSQDGSKVATGKVAVVRK